MRVPTVRTPSTAAAVLGAFIAALPPGAPRVAANLMAAQSAIETAHWRSMNNWNLWNITPSHAQLAAGIAWMDQGLAPMQYIAYRSILDSAIDAVAWSKRRGYFDALYAGDVGGYLADLRATCFLGCVGNTDPLGHTVTDADYAAYGASIASISAQLASVTPSMPAPAGASPGLELAAVAALAVAAGILVGRGRLPALRRVFA